MSLFPVRPLLAIDTTAPSERDDNCQLCKLHEGRTVINRCIPASATRKFEHGEAVLVVVDEITPQDDARGATAVGPQGAIIRRLIADATTRPVVYTAATRCAYVTDKHGPDNCRQYLVDTINTVKPYCIIVFGPEAAMAVFGEAVPVHDAIGGYSFLRDNTVIHVMPPMWLLASNQLWQQHTALELVKAFASSHKPDFLAAKLVIVNTPHKAYMALDDMSDAEALTFDCEYFGQPYDKEFRISLLALSAFRSDIVYSFDWQALEDDEILSVVTKLLKKQTPKIGQSIKVDVNAVFCEFGIVCGGVYYDTRLVRKLLRADAGATLNALSYMVGMGGFKDEFGKELDSTIRRLRKQQNKEAKVLYAPWGDKFYLPDGADAKRYAYAMTDPVITRLYNARDVLATNREAARQIELLKTDELSARVFTLVVQPATEALCQIERWGAPVDRGRVVALQAQLAMSVESQYKVLRGYGLENPNSNPQIASLIFDKLGLKYKGMKKRSTDKKAMKALIAATNHPFLSALGEYRKVSKLKSTYADGILDAIRGDGRIHPDMKLDGAETGRLSCVAHWTPVKTKRGVLPISSVVVGDYVWTHMNRWRQVTAHWSNGTRETLDFVLANGNTLTCTADHRLLLSTGQWVHAEDYVYECFKEMGVKSAERESNFSSVQGFTNASDVCDCCNNAENEFSECLPHSECAHARSRIARTTGDAVLCGENGYTKSDARKNWRSPPQLDRSLRGWLRLPDLSAQGSSCICAQAGHGAGAGTGTTGSATGNGSAPHRWEFAEQFIGQSCVGDEQGPSGSSFFAGQRHSWCDVKAIYASGSHEVYDLSVEEDHSYETSGIFSHNCVNPNLQNIPRAKTLLGKQVRDLFCAGIGRVLVEFDYSQLELRVAAMLSGDVAMTEIFLSGVDYHFRTAQLIAPIVWGKRAEDITKDGPERDAAKQFNFSLLYGKSIRSLAEETGLEERVLEKIKSSIFGAFPSLAKWITARERETTLTGYAFTYLDGLPGRRRPMLQIAGSDSESASSALRSSYNTPVQGTGSDYCTRSIAASVNWLRTSKCKAKLVLAVHDSLLFEVYESALPQLLAAIPPIMEGWYSGNVPLIADCKVGKSWGSMNEVKLER